ncbi:MAG TPA: ethanolamine ammonia-lyase reactivating factor EutA [Methylophilaceae bacterium]|nr:ethanolamine ammonia-lyase reactivating factor EutA [Methylophilaceae bacterium]
MNTPLPNSRVKLLGLDFGSTTCSAMVAEADVTSNSVTGRMEFSEPTVIFRSTPVFTPFINHAIDEAAVAILISGWLEQSSLAMDEATGVPVIFAGGSIITGLAAQKQNAAALTAQISQRVGETVIATAQDPCLESWLAFMGSCSALSRYHAEMPLLNFDIGGGTTNVALGLQGDVLATGCYFIGARHFQFVPGSYQLTAMSDYGLALLDELGIEKGVGDTLETLECEQIMLYYCRALEAIVLGKRRFFTTEIAQQHEQVAMLSRPELSVAKLTFSGGVGELLYQHMAGEALPGTTFYGDFGIDLALAIANSPLLSADLASHIPENRGRATVYGLTLHSTEISGTTLFLPRPESLPLRDLPIVSKLSMQASQAQWLAALELAKKREQGACIQILADSAEKAGLNQVRLLGQHIEQALAACEYPGTQPLVILIEANIGKALGNYATNWTKSGHNLVVIDEVPIRNAHFVNIGRVHQQIVPISFFGLH